MRNRNAENKLEQDERGLPEVFPLLSTVFFSPSSDFCFGFLLFAAADAPRQKQVQKIENQSQHAHRFSYFAMHEFASSKL